MQCRREALSAIRAKLAGSTEPSVPADLVWLPHEPTWQQVVDGRVKHGRQEFEVVARSEGDNAELTLFTLTARKAGLRFWRGFREHESTTWPISSALCR